MSLICSRKSPGPIADGERFLAAVIQYVVVYHHSDLGRNRHEETSIVSMRHLDEKGKGNRIHRCQIWNTRVVMDVLLRSEQGKGKVLGARRGG